MRLTTQQIMDDLTAEMREAWGDDLCQACWDELWGAIIKIDVITDGRVSKDIDEDEFEVAVEEIFSEVVDGTAADLPSIRSYIARRLEENAK